MPKRNYKTIRRKKHEEDMMTMTMLFSDDDTY